MIGGRAPLLISKKVMKQHAWCQRCALDLYVKFSMGESDSEPGK